MERVFEKLFGPVGPFMSTAAHGVLEGGAAKLGEQSINNFVKNAPNGFLDASITDNALLNEVRSNHIRNRVVKNVKQVFNPFKWNPLSLGAHMGGAVLDERSYTASKQLAQRLAHQRLKADALSVAAPIAVVGSGTAGYLLGKKHDK